MEETQSHRQSPSVWGSMQDLALWDINDDEKGQRSARYYCYSGFICDILSLNVKNVPMIKIIHSYIFCKWANLQNQQGIK